MLKRMHFLQPQTAYLPDSLKSSIILRQNKVYIAKDFSLTESVNNLHSAPKEKRI